MKKRKSFALIEVIVAVAIFALSATLIVGAILNIFRTSARFSIQRQVNQEALNAMETITRNTRAALGQPGRDTVVAYGNSLDLYSTSSLKKSYALLTDPQTGTGSIQSEDQPYTMLDNPKPLDVMMVLDNSGSMSPYIDELKADADKFTVIMLDQYKDNPVGDLQMGLVTFGSTAGPPLHIFTPLGPPERIFMQIGEIKESTDGTNIYEGIKMGAEELVNNSSPDRQKVIVLFTDGLVNNPDTQIPLIMSSVNVYKQQGIEFFTIGLSETCSNATMRDFLIDVAGSGNRFFCAPTPDEMEEAFIKLPQKITTYVAQDSITNSYLTSDQVDVTSLSFADAGSSSNQPYIKIILEVASREPENSWKYVETRIETVVSSRDYQ